MSTTSSSLTLVSDICLLRWSASTFLTISWRKSSLKSTESRSMSKISLVIFSCSSSYLLGVGVSSFSKFCRWSSYRRRASLIISSFSSNSNSVHINLTFFSLSSTWIMISSSYFATERPPRSVWDLNSPSLPLTIVCSKVIFLPRVFAILFASLTFLRFSGWTSFTY